MKPLNSSNSPIVDYFSNVGSTMSNKNWTWKLTDFEIFKERIKDFKK